MRNTFEGAAKNPDEAKPALENTLTRESTSAAESASARDSISTRASTPGRQEDGPVPTTQHNEKADKSDHNGTGLRSRAMEALKRAAKSKNGSTNGTSHSNAVQKPVKDDDGDDYVIRTERMTLNRDSERPNSSKGKGKGKGKSRELVVDGPAGGPVQDGHTNGNGNGGHGEDLYD